MKVKDKYVLRGKQGVIGVNYKQVHICIEENVTAYINALLDGECYDNEDFVKRFSIDEKILRKKIEENSNNPVSRTRLEMSEELKEIVINQIKKAILSKYNADIDDYLIALYAFWKMYQGCMDELNNFIQTKMIIEPSQKQIEELISRRKNTIVNSEEENGPIQTFEECESISFKKLHEEFSKLISNNNKELEEGQIEEIEKNIFSDAIYLGLFCKDALTTNISFLSEWTFYPVTEVFHDIISELDKTGDEESYREFSDNEKKYFDCLCAGSVEFNSIKRKKVETDGKKRNVYYVQDEFEKIVIRYLQKRLNIVFRVKYPNRDLIMEKCIRLIDSLPDLEDYTVYRFDFENFFESVNCEAFFEKYVEPSRMKRFEKNLIRKLIDKSPSIATKNRKNYKGCLQGIGTSNAITEIVAREFDSRVRSRFIDSGLVCYERFVDDGILIFNRLIDKDKIVRVLENCMNEVFGEQMAFQYAKTVYQTKTGSGTDSEFDFLGYHISKVTRGSDCYMQFGLAEKKRLKYQKRVERIFDLYEEDIASGYCEADELLRQRLKYMDSRVVFHNMAMEKWTRFRNWDVYGIINNYRMLRGYIQNDTAFSEMSEKEKQSRYEKICSDTKEFLLKVYTNEFQLRLNRGSITNVPYFMEVGLAKDYSLWSSFCYNRSIVFHQNIGWSSKHLSVMLRKIGVRGSLRKYSYAQKVGLYCSLVNKK